MLPLLEDVAGTSLESAGVDELDLVLKALADPTRIRILNVLGAGELCVCDLVELLALPQPAISRHLAHLRRAGLVVVTRQSRFAHYRLADGQALPAAVASRMAPVFEAVAELRAERLAGEGTAAARKSSPC